MIPGLSGGRLLLDGLARSWRRLNERCDRFSAVTVVGLINFAEVLL